MQPSRQRFASRPHVYGCVASPVQQVFPSRSSCSGLCSSLRLTFWILPPQDKHMPLFGSFHCTALCSQQTKGLSGEWKQPSSYLPLLRQEKTTQLYVSWLPGNAAWLWGHWLETQCSCLYSYFPVWVWFLEKIYWRREASLMLNFRWTERNNSFLVK